MKPKVSVCMASYNGEKYIGSQIRSIILQISSQDEIIIVDDNSKDNTVAVIESFKDIRIKVIKNEKNLGVLKSFAKAIEYSTGDYIFLSDQDDIWLPGKIVKMLSAMRSSEKMVCLSDAYILNENGKCEETFLKSRNVSRNLLGAMYKNFFIGCCMAFDKKIKSKILPFPSNINMHDQWIGVVSLVMDSFVLVNEPLILYRRHSNNVTSMKRGDITSIIRKRSSVIGQVLIAMYRKSRKI
ncbi:glycosyltransferase family 2 protein [Deinococcus aquiradiocola]|uniref:Alpha-L-Rha alpha-1,3-L-rhamnosyltransferase n=1 Tax=Deinococcus aquiradiocola TaxID=393059 RepID=A0A917USW0_9DEIO|nr:glycosyltransferase family 2 protein [Deinococcus aquiradiocola]GGJ82619.1 alpha-L-Rha alpha-1,3-L-rhamnosyltransferase [Deinococcus aquiradiocola]